jgi:hypothetical protein
MRLKQWYTELARKLPARAHFVEIGVAYGHSLAFFCEKAPHHTRVTGVDIWEEHQGREQLDPETWLRVTAHGTPIQACMAELRAYCPEAWARVSLHRATGKDAAALYADGSVDAVFIDEHHTFNSVTESIQAWLPKVRAGGWLSGHDCNDHYPGVLQAVNTWLTNPEVFPPHTEDNGWGGVWTWRKPEWRGTPR